MRIVRNLARSVTLLGVSLMGIGHACADLPADNIGQEKLAFPPEPHRAYIVDVEFESMVAGRVVVVDPDQKRMLGMVSTGFTAPSTLSRDGKLLYTADLFYSRGTRGTRTDVLTAWDTSTLSPSWEVVIPSKRSRVVNVGETYYYTTTTGTIRAVDLSGKEPRILPAWELEQREADKKAGWAPGGWQLMAVAPKLNRLYVLMHDAHEPMKWEDPSPIIWAYDLKTH